MTSHHYMVIIKAEADTQSRSGTLNEYEEEAMQANVRLFTSENGFGSYLNMLFGGIPNNAFR